MQCDDYPRGGFSGTGFRLWALSLAGMSPHRLKPVPLDSLSARIVSGPTKRELESRKGFLPEAPMKKLAFALALFLVVPALRAQQAETSGNPPQAEPQTAPEAAPPSAAQNPNSQDNLPASIRPGHPLDPADVDILTGKRNREIEAAQRAGVPYSAGMYGNYGDPYLMLGRFGRAFDIQMLPLTRIINPFFFSTMQPRGFGRSGFRGSR
jgi:hypothetical protein